MMAIARSTVEQNKDQEKRRKSLADIRQILSMHIKDNRFNADNKQTATQAATTNLVMKSSALMPETAVFSVMQSVAEAAIKQAVQEAKEVTEKSKNSKSFELSVEEKEMNVWFLKQCYLEDEFTKIRSGSDSSRNTSNMPSNASSRAPSNAPSRALSRAPSNVSSRYSTLRFPKKSSDSNPLMPPNSGKVLSESKNGGAASLAKYSLLSPRSPFSPSAVADCEAVFAEVDEVNELVGLGVVADDNVRVNEDSAMKETMAPKKLGNKLMSFP